jgi:hypothetical protein
VKVGGGLVVDGIAVLGARAQLCARRSFELGKIDLGTKRSRVGSCVELGTRVSCCVEFVFDSKRERRSLGCVGNVSCSWSVSGLLSCVI